MIFLLMKEYSHGKAFHCRVQLWWLSFVEMTILRNLYQRNDISFQMTMIPRENIITLYLKIQLNWYVLNINKNYIDRNNVKRQIYRLALSKTWLLTFNGPFYGCLSRTEYMAIFQNRRWNALKRVTTHLIKTF